MWSSERNENLSSSNDLNEEGFLLKRVSKSVVVERYDYIKRKRFTEPQTWTYELELEEDFELDGYYWDALVKCYLQTGRVAMTDEVHFDSESSMFCIYSSNESDLRLFAQSFKEACADPLCLEEMLRGFGEYLD